MIQFNLLPDSKLQNVKAKRSQHTILLISIIASLVAIGVLVLSLVLVGVQKYSLNSTQDTIDRYTDQINKTENITDILTVQNQLKTLTDLHKQEPVATRLFTYLPQITPTQASISQLMINFDEQSMQINGTATSLQAVNEFADTLKFTTYKIGSQNADKTAFTSVVLANFGRDSAGASFSFNLKYDPALFDASQDVKLAVPQNYITTRSFIELPHSALFNTTSPSAAGGGSR